MWLRRLRTENPRRREHRFHRLEVARAAAKVSRQRIPHFRFRGIGALREQGFRTQNHSWCAKPALDGAVLQESFLKGIQFSGLLNTFNGQDFAPLRLCRKHQAGINRFAVHQNRAGPALPRFTASLYAEITLSAQHIQQKVAGRDGPSFRFTVHLEAELHGVHRITVPEGLNSSARCSQPRKTRPCSGVRSFGVRQLAAAFLPASSLAGLSHRAQFPTSKLAGTKAAASCRTPKLRSVCRLSGSFRILPRRPS